MFTVLFVLAVAAVAGYYVIRKLKASNNPELAAAATKAEEEVKAAADKVEHVAEEVVDKVKSTVKKL